MVILEVCGFNHWLVKMLHEYGCQQVILIQPERRSKRKDRPSRRQRAVGTAVGQSPPAIVRQAGPGRATRRLAHRRGGGRSATDGLASTPGAAPHADHQPPQAPLAQAQPRSGLPDQRDRHDQRAEVVGERRPARPGSPGVGPSLVSMEAVGRADEGAGRQDPRAIPAAPDGAPCWRRSPAAAPTAVWR